MKPKPFSALNHLTVPCAMGNNSFFDIQWSPHFVGSKLPRYPHNQRDMPAVNKKSPLVSGHFFDLRGTATATSYQASTQTPFSPQEDRAKRSQRSDGAAQMVASSLSRPDGEVPSMILLRGKEIGVGRQQQGLTEVDVYDIRLGESRLDRRHSVRLGPHALHEGTREAEGSCGQ